MVSRIRIGLVLQGDANWVGGVEYGKNLLKALYALPPDEQATFEVVPLTWKGVAAELYEDMPARFHQELQVGLVEEPRWRQFCRARLPRWFDTKRTLATSARDQGLTFMYPYIRRPGDPGRPRVASFIPDFQYRYLQRFYSDEQLRHLEERSVQSIERADGVFLISENARRDFARFYPTHVPKAHVLTFRTGAPAAWFEPDPAAVVHAYGLLQRYFIVCNQFWQHKNHRAIFAALEILGRRGVRPFVVCTGNLVDFRRENVADWVDGMLQEFGVRDQVRVLGLIPRLEQIQLVRGALAVIQPSLFEGWSTGVEDARALGKRIALSNLDVHREQDPPQARFFDPQSPEALAEILSEWWQTLPPGPDREMEALARMRGERELVDYGRRFLKLARAA